MPDNICVHWNLSVLQQWIEFCFTVVMATANDAAVYLYSKKIIFVIQNQEYPIAIVKL